MKPNLNNQIESSQKRIDYVDSLEEKTYTDVWDKKPQSAETVFTKQQMIDLGISNNIPEYMKKIKRRKLMFTILKYVISTIIAITAYNLKYN